MHQLRIIGKFFSGDVTEREMTLSKSVIARIALVCLLLVLVHAAVGQDKPFLLSLRGTLTTGSQIFQNPDSPDEVERSRFVAIENSVGYGVELKYLVPETDIAVGIGVEYIRTSSPFALFLSPTRNLPVEDGYRVIPVELTGYFIIPVSGPRFGIYMGGGGGAYFGRRIYRIAGVDAASVDEGRGFGIHVLAGIHYRLNEWFSLIGEMKFRDLQFSARNAFPVSQIRSGNSIVSVSTKPFPSRVHTDGIIFQLGTAFSF